MFATAFVLRRRSAIKRLPALATEFKNENDNQLIGKISNNKMLDGQSGIKDDLAHELKGFQIIYDTVGPHPNLVYTYGIAHVSYEKKMKRTVDGFHPGPTAMGVRNAKAVFPRKWDTIA